MIPVFTLAGVDDLVDELRAAGIRADVDRDKVNAPGVWVQPAGFDLDTLATTRTAVRLMLIVPDKDPRRAYKALVDLLNKVTQVIPVRSAVGRSVLMSDGAMLPGLEVQWAVRAPIPEPNND